MRPTGSFLLHRWLGLFRLSDVRIWVWLWVWLRLQPRCKRNRGVRFDDRDERTLWRATLHNLGQLVLGDTEIAGSLPQRPHTKLVQRRCSQRPRCRAFARRIRFGPDEINQRVLGRVAKRASITAAPEGPHACDNFGELLGITAHSACFLLQRAHVQLVQLRGRCRCSRRRCGGAELQVRWTWGAP